MAKRDGQSYILRLTAAQRAELERLARELDRWPRFAERFGLRPPRQESVTAAQGCRCKAGPKAVDGSRI